MVNYAYGSKNTKTFLVSGFNVTFTLFQLKFEPDEEVATYYYFCNKALNKRGEIKV